MAPPRIPDKSHYDVIVVGTGMGGGTLAYALTGTGATVLMIERGDFPAAGAIELGSSSGLHVGPVQER